MLYTSLTKSLALLESLVHTPSGAQPRDLVLIILRLPPKSVATLAPRQLPKDWDTFAVAASTQQIGDNFFMDAKHLALKVPSVIVPGEFNVIINPLHSKTKQIEIVEIVDLPVDPRLVGR
jgi:RES domain-containing protein